MKESIVYIVATWLGHRRSSFYTKKIKEDPFSIIRSHIKILSSLSIQNIEKIIIVINENIQENDLRVKEAIADIEMSSPVEVIIRENSGFSYGAWEHAMRLCLKENLKSNYFFLIEDDYVPVREDFCDFFIREFEDNVGIVVQRFSNEWGLGEHASVSNGLIKREAAKSSLEKNGKIFDIVKGSTYKSATINQINYLKTFLKDFEIRDLSKTTKTSFYEFTNNSPTVSNTGYYGSNLNPIIIHPVYTEHLIRDLLDSNNSCHRFDETHNHPTSGSLAER